MKHRRSISTALAALFGLGLALPAQAQEENFFTRDRFTAVTERAQPDFDPEPVRLGAFEWRPTLELGVAYDSNIFAASTGETSDVIALIAPSLAIRSNWSRHGIGLNARIAHEEFLDQGDESYTGYGVNASGRIDINSRSAVDAIVRAERSAEPRYAAASLPQAAERVELDRLGAEVGAGYEFGRVQLRGRLAADSYDYSDVKLASGGTADQDYRDRTDTQLSARAAYAVDRDWAVFAEARYIDSQYDNPNTVPGTTRDSTGQVLLVGTDFELQSLLRGQVALGYLKTDFDDPAFADIDGLSVDTRVQWFVSQLTTLTGTARRSVVDPGLAGVAGAVETAFGVRGDHELRRNWLVFGEAEIRSLDFEGISRKDDRLGLGVGSLWKINKRAWLEAAYRYTNQDSPVQDFNDHRLSVSLKLYP